MDNKDWLILQMLVLDLTKLTRDLKDFNKLILSYKNYISDPDFRKNFSKEVHEQFTSTAALYNELFNTCNDFELKIKKLKNSIKSTIVKSGISNTGKQNSVQAK